MGVGDCGRDEFWAHSTREGRSKKCGFTAVLVWFCYGFSVVRYLLLVFGIDVLRAVY
jgi:hypothetical protein